MARIAIDLHGGDFGPSVLIPACLHYFRAHPEHHGVLFGDQNVCKPLTHFCPTNIEWIDTKDIAELAHKPAQLMRRDSFSSIETAFKALRDGQVDALVSAEHTGVLLVLVAKYGELHSALNRPVLAAWLPTLTGTAIMLDLGASFTANQQQLLSYAAIGTALVPTSEENPRLSLLNVGAEYFKGPEALRLAHATLQGWPNINYRGFIEASDIFTGKTDVIVCDGFTGNSIIKASTGALDLTFALLKARLERGLVKPLLAWWLKRQLKTVLKKLDPRLANGALVTGSNLLVVKSHGNANDRAFTSAIERAVRALALDSTGEIRRKLDKLDEKIPLDRA
jgi:glycerol-3-phosphate acyltransferase PlsX